MDYAIVSMPRFSDTKTIEFIGTLAEVRNKITDGYLNDIYGAIIRQKPETDSGFITRSHIIDIVELDEETLEFVKPYRNNKFRWFFYRFYPYILTLEVLTLSLIAFVVLSFIPALLSGNARQYINEIINIF